MLAQAQLRELFDYHEDGYLVWRTQRSVYSRIEVGSRAGTGPDENGYYRVMGIPLHRVIFYWHHGFLPLHVDHDDRDPGNNRIGNLLDSNAKLNGRNRGATVRSVTGVKGVTPSITEGRLRAQRTMHGKTHYVGTFDTTEEAAEALERFDAEHGLYHK